MTILHVLPNVTVEAGGSASTMANIIGTLRSVDIGAEVLALELPGRPLPVDAPVTRFPSSFPARLSNSVAAGRWYQENRERFGLLVLHSTWTLLNLRVAAAARRAGKPYAVIAHNSLDPFDLRKKAYLKKMLGPLAVRRYLAGSRGIICATALEKDRLVTYGADPTVHVLPWSVDPITPSATRAEVRASRGWADNEFVVLSLGRIDFKKGFPVLIAAFQRLFGTGLKTRLLIVGPDAGGYLDTVKTMVARSGVAPATTFIDTISGGDKAALMGAVDCLALPSLNENFGNVVVESMQYGVPVVISHNVYICDMVAETGSGFVCRYDAEEFFVALRRLAEDPVRRSQMGLVARQAGMRFTTAALQGRYRELFGQLLSSPGANAG